MEKTCKGCGKAYPNTTEYFYTSAGNLCISCHNKKGKQNYEKNKRRILEKQKEYQKNNKDKRNKYLKEYNKKNEERLKEYKARYRENNKEALNEYQKQHYKQNKEQKKMYYEKNKKRILARKKQFYKKNKEHIKAVRKVYYENNGNKIKQYRQNNREYIKEVARQYQINHKLQFILYTQKRYALKNKLPNNFTPSEWEACINYFAGECAYCGERHDALEQEHFVALTKGGEYTKNNIIPACRGCNPSKGNKDFFDWYPRQEFYSKEREDKILKYLNYNKKTKIQQLTLL